MKKFLFLFFFLIIAQNALGHASPILTIPHESTLLESAPKEVTIYFSERIDPKSSSIVIHGPGGTQKYPLTTTEDQRALTSPFTSKENGTFHASWSVLSLDDGHHTKGAFTFSIGNESPNAEHEETHYHFSLLTVIFVFLELFGQSIIVATILLSFWGKQNSKLRILGAILIIIGSGGIMTQEYLDHQTLPTDTKTGQITLARFIIGAIILATPSIAIITIAMLASITLRAFVSHAMATDFLPYISTTITALHLLSKETWLASLIMLTFYFDHKTRTNLKRILAITLGTTATTALYLIWLHLKEPANLLTTDWGLRLCILLVPSAILVTLRIIDHFRKAHNKPFAKLELCTALIVLLASSMVLMTTPALNTTLDRTEIDDSKVTLAHTEDKFAITIDTAHPIEHVTVILNNPAKNIGPIVPEITYKNGAYHFPTRELTIGTWNIEIVAKRTYAYDLNAKFTIDYPQDLISSKREFGTFEITLTVLGLLAITLSILLQKTIK